MRNIIFALSLLLSFPAHATNIFWGDSIPLGKGIERFNYPAHIGFALDEDVLLPVDVIADNRTSADIGTDVYLYTPQAGNRHFLSGGANDARMYGMSSTSRANYKRALMAQIYWLAGTKKLADTPGFTYTGSWTPILTHGRLSISPSATVSFTFTGDALVLGHYIFDKTFMGGVIDGQSEVRVDGQVVGTYSVRSPVDVTVPAPVIFRRTGFGPGTHNVTIKNLSGNTPIEWVWTGSNGFPLYVSSILQTGNQTTIPNSHAAYYNAALLDAVSEAQADGLSNVRLIDSRSVINPATDLQADKLHLTQAAARKLAEFFLDAIGEGP